MGQSHSKGRARYIAAGKNGQGFGARALHMRRKTGIRPGAHGHLRGVHVGGPVRVNLLRINLLCVNLLCVDVQGTALRRDLHGLIG